jgi:hypothetical protein
VLLRARNKKFSYISRKSESFVDTNPSVAPPSVEKQEGDSTDTALSAEVMECQSVGEIFEIVAEEASHMSGQSQVFALQRVVHLSLSQLRKLRHAPEFASLVETLEEHIHDLGPKVTPACHCSLICVLLCLLSLAQTVPLPVALALF